MYFCLFFLFVPAGLRVAQPSGIVFTHWPKNGFFAPQGRRVATINVKVGTGERIPRANFHVYWGKKCGNTAPKTVKISNFGKKFVVQGRLVCNFLTKFSAFVRGYR